MYTAQRHSLRVRLTMVHWTIPLKNCYVIWTINLAYIHNPYILLLIYCCLRLIINYLTVRFTILWYCYDVICPCCKNVFSKPPQMTKPEHSVTKYSQKAWSSQIFTTQGFNSIGLIVALRAIDDVQDWMITISWTRLPLASLLFTGTMLTDMFLAIRLHCHKYRVGQKNRTVFHSW